MLTVAVCPSISTSMVDAPLAIGCTTPPSRDGDVLRGERDFGGACNIHPLAAVQFPADQQLGVLVAVGKRNRWRLDVDCHQMAFGRKKLTRHGLGAGFGRRFAVFWFRGNRRILQRGWRELG